jgi:hypothetical protein
MRKFSEINPDAEAKTTETIKAEISNPVDL